MIKRVVTPYVAEKRTKRRYKKKGVKHRKKLGPKSHLRIP
tara:strand:+ start:309 stop:428 length:120 start_codon:yes stop_codon:yes gene_type:complete